MLLYLSCFPPRIANSSTYLFDHNSYHNATNVPRIILGRTRQHPTQGRRDTVLAPSHSVLVPRSAVQELVATHLAVPSAEKKSRIHNCPVVTASQATEQYSPTQAKNVNLSKMVEMLAASCSIVAVVVRSKRSEMADITIERMTMIFCVLNP